MGLINQPGIFNGTPALNPLPYVNIAMQAMARKRAYLKMLLKMHAMYPSQSERLSFQNCMLRSLTRGSLSAMSIHIRCMFRDQRVCLMSPSPGKTLTECMHQCLCVRRLQMHFAARVTILPPCLTMGRLSLL